MSLRFQDIALKAAVHEQFSKLASLDNHGETASSLRRSMAIRLNELRRDTEVKMLPVWHQAYNLFRTSAHCFVNAVKAMNESNYEQSLDYAHLAYNINVLISESPPEVRKKRANCRPC